MLLLDNMHGEAAEGGLTGVVCPPPQAWPGLAMVPARSTLMLIGCRLPEGYGHPRALADSLDSTDINKLWMKGPNVINQQLHDAASRKVAAGHIHRLRVAFRVGSTARGGGVNIVGNEINVVITPPMLPAAVAGVSWAKQAERLLELPVSGIGPHVQILGDDMAAELQCHVFFVYGQAFSGVGRCPPRLRTEYNAAAAATQDSVASVVGIIDRVLGDVPLRNQLVDATNVAVWRSLGSVPTP